MKSNVIIAVGIPIILMIIGPLFMWIDFKREQARDAKIKTILVGERPALPLAFEWRKFQAYFYFNRWHLISFGLLSLTAFLLWVLAIGPLSLMLAIVVLFSLFKRVSKMGEIFSKSAFIIDESGINYGGEFIGWNDVQDVRLDYFLRNVTRIRIMVKKELPEGIFFTFTDRIDLPILCIKAPYDFVAYSYKLWNENINKKVVVKNN